MSLPNKFQLYHDDQFTAGGKSAPPVWLCDAAKPASYGCYWRTKGDYADAHCTLSLPVFYEGEDANIHIKTVYSVISSAQESDLEEMENEDVGRSKTYKLSSGRIEFLRRNPSARTSLIEQLDEKGFRVSFDFDLQVVNIVSESGKDANEAKLFIDDSVVETEFPANAFVRTDKLRQSIEVVYLRNRTNNSQLRVTGASADIDSSDVAHTKCVSVLDSFVSCEGSVYINAYSSISNEGSEVCTSTASAVVEGADSASPIETDRSCEGTLETRMTKFRCKSSAMKDALQKEAQVIERKYNCHITQIHPRSTSDVCHPNREPKIEIQVTTIQDLETDVIVNSANEGLNLKVGKGLSQILLKAAGEGIQSELLEHYPNGIQHGEVAKTGPGDMRTCKAIYHGTLPLFPQDKSAKTYRSTVAKCYKALVSVILKALLMASSDGRKSVAFPVLGTGNLGYPVNEVVQLMFLAVSQFFESTVSPVEKVIFVIYPKAEPLFKQLFLMEKYSWQLQTVKVEGTITAHKELQSNPTKICETQYVTGRTFLQISNVDIPTAMDTSDVILILWQDGHFDSKIIQYIVVASTKRHPVLSSLEPSVQRTVYEHYAPHLQNHTTKVVIDDQSWKPARLIHLYCKSDAIDVIVRAIQRGLKQIKKDDVTTVAIPVPSDGSTIWQPHIAARLIAKAVSGLRELHHVVRVIIQDGNLLEQFLAEVSKATNSRLHQVPDVSHVFDTFFLLDSCNLPVGNIEIHVSSDSEEKNETAAKELKDVLGIKLMYMLKDK